jgi:hypothetical protein
MATLRLTCVNVLKAKDRGEMDFPARSRAVASAPSSVKALRYAATSAQTKSPAVRLGFLLRGCLSCALLGD